jgi:hypothetical protein
MFAGIQTGLYDSIINENIGSKDEKTRYKVILKGIGGAGETKEAFAIKFSLLTKAPVSRTKFLIKNTPFVVWKGLGKRNAQKFLSIIEEAGGKGTIIEVKMDPERTKDDSEKAGGENVCPNCGMPLSKDDKFCPFCTTPIGPVLSKKKSKKTTFKTSKPAVPTGRMVFYFIVIVGLILFALLSS